LDFINPHQALVVLKHIIENIQEAICVIDEKGIVVIWNEPAEKLYQLPRQEIIGKYLGEFFPNAIDLKVLESKKPVTNVYHSPREGTHIIISAAPILIGDKCIGVVSTDKDISEIRRVSLELEKATEKLNLLKGQIERLTGSSWGGIIGKSKLIQDTIEIAKRAAESKVAILITGESGTGKEVFARAIHAHSGLQGSFVPVNCSAIPKELFESEFFGYEPGAFTGAHRRGKKGLFELAHEGTLFLDEIADLPMFMQSKLLRALEEKKIKKVGGEKPINVNVRIVSATNRDLPHLVEEGKFRDDLFYRLNVIHLKLPPLRDRPEDIISLLKFFYNRLVRKTKSKSRILIPRLSRS
jgi:PAS domain S-box-containing protein